MYANFRQERDNSKEVYMKLLNLPKPVDVLRGAEATFNPNIPMQKLKNYLSRHESDIWERINGLPIHLALSKLEKEANVNLGRDVAISDFVDKVIASFESRKTNQSDTSEDGQQQEPSA